MRAQLLGATFAALAVVALAAAPAEAQRRDGSSGGAYDSGYRDGARAGGDDARERPGFEYQRHRDYRAADRGYSNRDNRRDAYTQQYRAGFVAGYRDGFYSAGGRGAGRAPRPGPVVRRERRDRGGPRATAASPTTSATPTDSKKATSAASTTAATATATTLAGTAATAMPTRATAASTAPRASTRSATGAASSAATTRATGRPARAAAVVALVA